MAQFVVWAQSVNFLSTLSVEVISKKEQQISGVIMAKKTQKETIDTRREDIAHVIETKKRIVENRTIIEDGIRAHALRAKEEIIALLHEAGIFKRFSEIEIHRDKNAQAARSEISRMSIEMNNLQCVEDYLKSRL